MHRRSLLVTVLLAAIATAIGVVLVLAIDWFPSQGAEEAKTIDTLYDVLAIISVPIFVLVMTVAIYCVVVFRAKPGDDSDGEPIHGNTKLEVVWVTIPFLIVSALAVYGWVVLDDIEEHKPNTLQVDVSGQQFAWSFHYPKQAGVPRAFATNTPQLPKGRPVQFDIRAADVLHSFWIPDFRLKQDAVPGLTTRIRLRPTEMGNHQIVCAELCGLGHSTMRQNTRVVTPKQFAAWAARQKGSSGSGGGGGTPGQASTNGAHALAEAATISKAGAVD